MPVLWHVKKRFPKADIRVFFMVFTRNDILRDSKYYTQTFESLGIRYYDFIDFIPQPFKAFGSHLRITYSKNTGKRANKGVVAFVRQKIRNRLINPLYDFLYKRINWKRLCTSIESDLILLDNTNYQPFYGKEHFYPLVYDKQHPVMLLPHAPHHAHMKAFTPFEKMEDGKDLPSFCEFWMPFINDRTWEVFPEKKDQFHYIGYPGLDQEWLDFIDSGKPDQASNSKTCLLIIRRFYDPGVEKDNDFIYTYDEFLELINKIAGSFNSLQERVNVIVKPHPSNDAMTTAELLTKSDLNHWSLSYESIYDVYPKADLIVSLYSTILLVPAIQNVPTVLINSSIQMHVSKTEESLRELYEGLPYFAAETELIGLKISEVLKDQKNATVKSSKEHIRKFFPDGALQRALNRIQEYNENSRSRSN